MILSHKIQLKPNKEQIIFFKKACGVARFTYNWALTEWNTQYANGEKPTVFKLKKQFNIIKKEKYPWIYESPKDANDRIFEYLRHAFSNFFNKKSKYPQFKKKNQKNSYYVSSDRLSFIDKHVKLPLIGKVKLTEALRFEGKIMAGTISSHADKWYISVAVEVNEYHKERTADNVIAIDFGLKNLITDQNGNIIKPLDQSKKELKLKKYQRQFSRRVKDGKNREKSRRQIAKIYKVISDKRNDFNHKLTTKLCRENQSIIIEDLNINGWAKLFGKSTANSSVGEIRRQINYKSLIYKNNVVVLDKWMPTSKACSSCGCYKPDLKLSERIFNCNDCGFSLDRDHNAALNIYRAGLARINALGH